MRSSFFAASSAALLFSAMVPAAWAGVPAPFSFQAPAGWSVGQSLTTYSEWAANNVDKIDGIPNVGFNDAGAGIAQPTLGTGHTGFVASSGGLYSFSDWYTATASLTAPTSGLPPAAGTYLVIQTFASINPDGVPGHASTVLGIDLLNPGDSSPIAGAQLIRSDVYGIQSNFPSPFGPVDVQATIDEFWIPNFTGDVNLVVREIIHSSFMGLRIDSAIAGPGAGGVPPFAATPVPEPASMGVLALSMGAMLLRRRKAV